MARVVKARDTQGPQEADLAIRNLADLAAEARSVLLDARRDAARIVADARSQAEEACRAAAETGYAEGLARGRNDAYADGHQQGLAEARKAAAEEAAELIPLARKLVEALPAARAELVHQARCRMLEFALELAAKIVGCVAARNVEAAQENLRKALEHADCGAGAIVKVNAGQLARLEECLPDLIDALGRTGEVELVGDEALSPGSVRLIAGQGEIDATIETQLANVAEALLGRPQPGRDAGLYEPVEPDWQRESEGHALAGREP
jgi:flagellar assembly protein FliH